LVLAPKGNPQRVVLFPGSWNPPTVAHLEIARAALRHGEAVIWVLPRAFPHKTFEGASFEQRLQMLRRIAAEDERFGVAVSDRGLYLEIAEEANQYFGTSTEIKLVMGRDAAERIASWDYGRAGVFEEFVSKYKLLVAARGGEYIPEAPHSERIESLWMGVNWDEVSSSEVRRCIQNGEQWKHLVPRSLIDAIDELY